MKVLLVASDKGELKGFNEGYIKVVSGVGPIMAATVAALAIAKEKPDIVVSIGSAGAISEELEVGRAYSFSRIVTPDQNLTSFHVALGSTLDSNRTTFGEIRTKDLQSRFILGSSGSFSKDLQPWHKILSADASDMESYGVGLAAFKTGVPFYAVKLITDRVGDLSTIGKIQFNLRKGRERLISLVSSILK